MGVGAGPAVWCHSLLPDYHAFSNRGGYAFPLHDRRPESAGPNVSTLLLERLSAAYGELVGPEAAFDAILCLLSANSYTLRFAEDLEDVFPHVPFPARHETFADAARLGAEIRALETFAQPPRGACEQPGFARLITEPRGPVAPVEFDAGAINLCADGSGRVGGVPRAVWEFEVSGYRVVPRWLVARVGIPADLTFVREFRDVCGRVAELIDLFARADTILEATLQETLTREALGLGGVAPEAEGAGQ